MPAATMLAGLTCGTLLAAAGLALWGAFRHAPGLSQAVNAVRWLAGTLLVIGTLLAWLGDHSPAGYAPQLTLMAALAAPPASRRHHLSRWSSAILTLPALVLAGIGLFWIAMPVDASAGNSPATLMTLAVAICGGLGARALGEAMNEVITSTPHVEWPSATAYALLTSIVGGTALVNLWQRGSTWAGTVDEIGLAGVWLAWCAAWVSPRRRRRLRAVLVALAALFLVALAARYPMPGA